LPDAGGDNLKGFAARIEREFEAANRGTDLELRRFDPNDDFYDLDTVSKWLGAAGPAEYDVVEIDTILLGELNLKVPIPTWSLPLRSWHEAARIAVRQGNEVLGVPHWLCSYFVMGSDPELGSVRSVSALARVLKSSAPPNTRLLAGDFQGSFTLPTYYLDAWADINISGDVESALRAAPENRVIRDLKQFSDLCVKDRDNPCLTDAKYNDDGLAAATEVATGGAQSLVAYSERLHHLQRASQTNKEWTLVSAPVGNGRHPAVFVDALVRSPQCTGSCAAAAASFAEYLTRTSTLEWMMLSDDVDTSSIPRYLIPAHRDAYTTRVLADAHYKQINAQLTLARPYPRFGFYHIRGDLRDRVREQLVQRK
jgi:thiamine pyridinylase